MACGSSNNNNKNSHAGLYLGYIIYLFGAEKKSCIFRGIHAKLTSSTICCSVTGTKIKKA